MKDVPLPTNPVFRARPSARGLVYWLLCPLIGLFLIGPAWMLVASPSESGFWGVLLLFGAFASAAIAWFILSALRTSVEILPDGIRRTGAWGPPEEIPFGQIAGYRVAKNRNTGTLELFTRDASRRPIGIGGALERQGELVRFLKAKFDDLDIADRKADMAAVLSDAVLGSTEGERRAALRRATVHVRILNTAVFAATFWGLGYPHPYALFMVLLAVLPLGAVALVLLSRGAATLYATRASVRANASYAFAGPCAALAFRQLRDWHILGWSGFWAPFALLGALMVGILWLGSAADPHRKAGAFLGLCLACLAQSYGLVLFLNCDLDRSVPAIHRTEVYSRRFSTGKHTTYYVSLGPWLGGQDYEEVAVGRSFYEAHSEGSVVLVGVRGGTLSMPWYFLQ